MSFFTKKRLGITIQDHLLVLCQVEIKPQGKTGIESINAVVLPKESFHQGRIIQPDKVRKALREGLKKAEPTAMKAKDVIFEIPESLTFQKRFTLPSNLAEEELREAVLLEAEKTLPFSADQVSWDYAITHGNESSNHILFTAVQIDIVQEYYDFFISSGLTPVGFSIRTENIIRTVADPLQKKMLILDLQNRFTTLLQIEEGHLKQLYQFNIGEHHFKMAIKKHFQWKNEEFNKEAKKLSVIDINLATLAIMEKLQENLMSKVKGVIPGTPKEKSKPFIFLGNSFYFYPLREFFKEKSPGLGTLQGDLNKLIGSQISSARLLNIFKVEKITKKKPNKTPTKKDDHVLLEKTTIQKMIPSAVGSALTDYASTATNNKPTNLLPPLVRSIALWKETNPWFFIMTTILLLFSIGWLMAFGFVWGSTTAQLRVARDNETMVQRQFENIKPLTIEYRIKSANDELKVIASLQKNLHPFAEIVKTIRMVLPPEITFTALQYGLNQNKTLYELKGLAKTRTEIIDTYQKLQTIPFIAQVQFPASNLDVKEDIPFTIRFTVEGGEEKHK